jgi:hypothetical protein
MKRILATSALILTLGAVALAIDTKTDYDRSADFAQYRTFAWKAPRAANGVVSNDLVMSRIQAAAGEQLGTKGLRHDTLKPDLYVVAHVAAKEVRDVDYLPPLGGWRNWGWMGPDIIVNEYVKGTIVLDLVDTKTNKLVWRAVTTDTASDLLDVQSAKNVDKMIADSLEHFPPKKAQSGN